jgi:hypothetical protein
MLCNAASFVCRPFWRVTQGALKNCVVVMRRTNAHDKEKKNQKQTEDDDSFTVKNSQIYFVQRTVKAESLYESNESIRI